jgi:hypothetical protein
MYGSAHPAYTTTQAVMQVFRRRVPIADGIRFAASLTDEPLRPFGTVEEMTAEARELRADHNFVEPDSIAVVSRVVWRHADAAKLQAALASREPAARAFWADGAPR